MKYTIRALVLFALLVLTALPVAANPDPGSSPYVAQPLGSGLNLGSLAPGQGFWYAFRSNDLSEQPARTVVLNMVYKPGAHDVAPYVNFQVFTSPQVERWLQGFTDQYTGMGTFTTTDFDQETAERLWSGSLTEGETYYVRLFNNSPQPVEYHLTALGQPAAASTAATPALDITPVSASPGSLKPGTTLEETQWQLVAAALQGMSTEEAAAWLMMASQAGWISGNTPGGQATAAYAAQPGYTTVERAALVEKIEVPPAIAEAVPAAPAPSPAELYPSVYPNAALALHDGVNVGKLAPGGEHWYSFIREDRDAELFEFMPITLFTTPADGNSSHHINFQIFTGNQLHVWTRGTPDAMVPMGAGQWVSRDKDPLTGERLWAGHVVDGDLYYVRVFNHTDKVVDYYLITKDIINTELGDRVWAANPIYGQTLWQPGSYIPVPR